MFLRRTYAAVFRRPKLTLEKKGTLVKIGRNILPLNLLATALLAGIRAGIAQSNVSVDSQGRLHLKVAYPNSQRLQDAFTDEQLVELAFLIGFINMLNWFNNALGVRYHGEFEGIEVV